MAWFALSIKPGILRENSVRDQEGVEGIEEVLGKEPREPNRRCAPNLTDPGVKAIGSLSWNGGQGIRASAASRTKIRIC